MYQNFEVSFFPLTERIVNLLSWFGKNCVSFFAFLSAYGLAVSYMKLSEKKGAADGWIKRRLLKLYKGYWFVFVGAFFYMFDNRSNAYKGVYEISWYS